MLDDLVPRLRQIFARTVDAITDALGTPVSLLQVVVIALAFGGAWLLDRIGTPSLETQARRIRGQPRLLRVVVALLRRMRLVFFCVLLWVFSEILGSAFGPSPNLVSIVSKLALAYLVIAVASRLVRNRLVARLITVVAWGLAALSILHLTDPVAESLDSTAIFIGQARISILLVGKALVVVAMTLWLASLVGHFLDTRIQRSEELTPTLRVLIGKFLKIGLILVALAVALASIGVDLTALTVLSGAVGVGLGFGLQKVVSNFISGIVILLDRSIKPGDTISLGDTFGWIRELRARFVSVVTRDGKEYLIPNEDFITSRVINWSFSDDLVRIDVKFGVSYDANPHEVSRVAIAAASAVPRVVAAKPVVCWLTGFGESSLDFVLRFWIRDPQQGLANIRGQVMLALWDALKANDIAIPFPVREVILRGTQRVDPEDPTASAEGRQPPARDRHARPLTPAEAGAQADAGSRLPPG